MTGAFAGRNSGQIFPVVDAMCKLVGRDGQTYAAIVNDILYDKNESQVQSLLSTHQSLSDNKNGIDDHSIEERDIHGNPGSQAGTFGQHKVLARSVICPRYVAEEPPVVKLNHNTGSLTIFGRDSSGKEIQLPTPEQAKSEDLL